MARTKLQVAVVSTSRRRTAAKPLHIVPSLPVHDLPTNGRLDVGSAVEAHAARARQLVCEKTQTRRLSRK